MSARAKSSGQESTPGPRQGIPSIPVGVQDHNFHTQAVFEIQREIGKLETGLDSVASRLTSVEAKLSGVSTQITELSTRIETLKPIVVWAMRALWGVLGSIVLFGLGLLSMWLKHYFAW